MPVLAKTICLSTALAVASVVSVLARNLDASLDSSPIAKHLHQSAGESAVPVSVENGQIVVNVSINGQGPFPMMFETGGVEAVTPEAATALGLTSEGSGTVQGSGEGKIPVAFTHLKDVRLCRVS
jgi:hypothetical protein